MTYTRLRASTVGSLILVLALQMLAGCSQSEDVRVTLCKRLAADLLANPNEIVWQTVDNEFHEPEYAVIRLRFESRSGAASLAPRRAACFYDYDTVEQNAMTHSQPLSAYASQPYGMTLDGDPVEKTRLTQAMHRFLRRQGETIIERVDQGVARAADKLR